MCTKFIFHIHKRLPLFFSLCYLTTICQVEYFKRDAKCPQWALLGAYFGYFLLSLNPCD
jgi:hypothetical protein